MECARRRAARSLRVFVRSCRVRSLRAPAASARRAQRRAARRTHRRRRDRDYVVKTLARKLIMKSKGVKSLGRSEYRYHT